MTEDAYIKFDGFRLTGNPLPFDSVEALIHWRDVLYKHNLIGAYDNKICFGNISERVDDSDQFIITGAGTGNLPTLEPKHFSLVREFNLEDNSLTCKGPIMASSESMTHGAIYKIDPSCKAVVHAHNKTMWHQLQEYNVPSTNIIAEYGTPEIAESVFDIFEETDVAQRKIFSMGGHQEGIISFGESLEEAVSTMMKHYKKITGNCVQYNANINDDYTNIKEKIRTIPHFPKVGIQFRDITTLLKDHLGFKATCDALYEQVKNENVDYVVGLESRGFIFGAALARDLDAGFIPIRKPGKLPGEVISQDFKLEYGNDTFEMHKDAIKKGDHVVIVDDLRATAGSAIAANKLVEKAGGKSVGTLFVIDMPDLGGKEKMAQYKTSYLIEFEGE